MPPSDWTRLKKRRSEFKHDPLDAPERQIRLLRRVGPQHEADPDGNKCHANCPPGTSRALHPTSASLTRLHRSSGYFWIDAICIDQANVEEKSAQVARMGDVYRDATEVYACVGPHENYGDLLFGCVMDFKKFGSFEEFLSLDNVLHENEIIDPEMEAAGCTMDDPSIRYGAQTILSSYPRAYPEARLDSQLPNEGPNTGWREVALDATRVVVDYEPDPYPVPVRRFYCAIMRAWKAFIERKYFSRSWIVQELCPAKKRTRLCGDGLVDFERMLDFEADLTLYFTDVKKGWNHYESIQKVFVEYGFRATGADIPFRALKHEIRYRSRGNRQACLLELLESFGAPDRHSSCSDVRDNAYSLLQMVDWRGCSPLVPDYSKTVLEVALDILRDHIEPSFAVRNGDNLIAGSHRRCKGRHQCDHVSLAAASVTTVCLAFDLHAHSHLLTNLVSDRRLTSTRETRAALLEKQQFLDRKRTGVRPVAYSRLSHSELDYRGHRLQAFLWSSSGHAFEWLRDFKSAMRNDPDLATMAVEYLYLPRGGPAFAMVPALAKKGDILLIVQLGIGTYAGILTREIGHGLNHFRIIGQGLVPSHDSFANHCKCEDRNVRVGEAAEMVIWFDLEDLLILSTQCRRGEYNDGSLARDKRWAAQMVHCLRTNVVKESDPFSSYAELQTKSSQDEDSKDAAPSWSSASL